MSGHSKWSTIHRQKEVKDAKRSAIFTKIAAAITVAVRQGRGLELAIEKAKQANMPKENIQRAIDKGKGGGEGDNLMEVVFEGFVPGGVAVMVKALTDNKLRTMQQVREVLDKGGGSLAGQGAVGYLFSTDMQPNFSVEVADQEMRNKVEGILEKLEDLDDVQEVWTNYA